MCCNNQYAKSCIRVYNANPQTVTATATTLVLEGTPVVESGCSLCLNPSSITIKKSGLYHLAADISFTPTAAGTFIVQLYKDGVALPCTIVQDTAETGNVFAAHVETDICVNACCVNNPEITLVVSGVAGTITRTCVGALKLA